MKQNYNATSTKDLNNFCIARNKIFVPESLITYKKGRLKMSKFNDYARRLNETAKKHFTEFGEASAGLNKAQEARKFATTEAEKARREGDLIEAREKYDALMSTWAERGERALQDLQVELEAAIAAAFVVNPADVNQNVVTLLNSGICSSADFERMLKDADNSTMQRLILSHVEKAATSPEVDPAERRALNVLLSDGRGNMGGAVLENFDALGGVFHRCLRNPSMIPRWDDLTADAIENF